MPSQRVRPRKRTRPVIQLARGERPVATGGLIPPAAPGKHKRVWEDTGLPNTILITSDFIQGYTVKAELWADIALERPQDADLLTYVHWVKDRWVGSRVVQAFADDELEALVLLQINLAQLELPEPPVLQRVIEAWDSPSGAWKQLPHAERPFQLREYAVTKPRERRTRHDPNGRPYTIYKDTGKRHSDPNCPCPYCNFNPPPHPEDYDT